jgi:membrane protein
VDKVAGDYFQPIEIKMFKFIKKIAVNFSKDRCFDRASALAYTNLLTIVPLLTLVLVIVTVFPFMNGIETQIENFIFNDLVPGSSNIHSYIKGFAGNAMKLSWISLAFLFVTVIMLLISIESTFNDILKTKAKHINYFKSLPRYAIFAIVMPALLGTSFVLSSYLYSLFHLSGEIYHFNLAQNLIHFIPTLLIFIMMLFLYKFIPAEKLSFRLVASGAVFTTIIFEASKKLFMLYIYFFSGYKALYGAFAAIPLFLLWLYISWVIILLGFEIISYFHNHRR